MNEQTTLILEKEDLAGKWEPAEVMKHIFQLKLSDFNAKAYAKGLEADKVVFEFNGAKRIIKDRYDSK